MLGRRLNFNPKTSVFGAAIQASLPKEFVFNPVLMMMFSWLTPINIEFYLLPYQSDEAAVEGRPRSDAHEEISGDVAGNIQGGWELVDKYFC
ncbi:MAG: hypothetical protein RLN62_02930 [Rickettsiales bacterium]